MEETASSNAIDFSPLLTALKEAISPTDVLLVLSAVIGAGIIFFLMWLGVRKAVTGFTSAVASGKLRI